MYQRDDKFRIKTINYPDTATEEFTYHPAFGLVVTHKMTSGGTEGFQYDSRGRLERYRDPYHDPINKTGKPTAWYQYDLMDRVSGVTDWRGTGAGDLNYTTNYEYNQRGQLTKHIHPVDSVTGARYFAENSYNNDSTLATTKNERGSTTTYGYDDYKRLSSITAPIAFVGDTMPRVTYFYYNRDGTATIDYRFTASAVANSTTPLSNTVKTLYDNDFWKRSATVGSSAEAVTTSYTYDSVGNLKTVTQPNSANVGDGPTYTYFYDKRNRLTDVDDAYHHQNHLGHTISWTYDQAGNKKSQLRANNQLVTYDQYDPMNRLQIETVQRDIGITDQTIMTYDVAGNLTMFTDGRQKQYTYTYDFLNRKRTAVYPRDDSGVMRQEQYHYDLANNMDTYTNRAGAVQTFTYDNRNRSTYFSWIDGTPARSTSYDQVGNIVKMSPTGNEFVYDLRNRLTSDIQSVAALGISRQVDYSYDADSNRKTVTYPSGMTFTYNYNSRNQLKSKSDASGAVVSYTYDLNGNRKTRTLRNGTTSDYFWDELDQLHSLDHLRQGSQFAFASFDYGHDVVGRIYWKGRDYSQSEGYHGEVYDYYLDDQLKSTKFDAILINDPNPPNATSFAYDSSGNRTTVSSRSTPSYTYTANDLNQYNSVNGSVPGYDTKGNLTSYNGWSYQYNGQNQLTVAGNGANAFNFYYDGMGRQTLRYENGSWIYSVWDGWNLVEEYNDSGTLLHAYLHGAATDEVVERFGGGAQTIWYYQDAQGSTTHLADDSGNVIERYKYDPALSGAPYIYNSNGQQIPASAFDNRFLYTGRDWIKEMGLYDYRNRFYLPSLGRFLQPDPTGFGGGDANLYRYCGNDPVNNVDENGLQRNPRGAGGRGQPYYPPRTQEQINRGEIRNPNKGVFMQDRDRAASTLRTYIRLFNSISQWFKDHMPRAPIKGDFPSPAGPDKPQPNTPRAPMTMAPLGITGGPILFGNLGSLTGPAMWWSLGTGWLPIGTASADVRWAPNSGTGNFTASQFTHYAQGTWGMYGSNNMEGAAIEGRFLMDDEGTPRMQGPMYGDPSRAFHMGQKSGAPTGVHNTEAFNKWLMQQPEYKSWMAGKGG